MHCGLQYEHVNLIVSTYLTGEHMGRMRPGMHIFQDVQRCSVDSSVKFWKLTHNSLASENHTGRTFLRETGIATYTDPTICVQSLERHNFSAGSIWGMKINVLNFNNVRHSYIARSDHLYNLSPGSIWGINNYVVLNFNYVNW